MRKKGATIATNLTILSREEKLKVWLDRQRDQNVTMATLAGLAGVSVSVISRSLRSKTMPTKRHKALRVIVPVELLPEALDKKPGRQRKPPKRVPPPEYLESLKHRPFLKPREVEDLYGIPAASLRTLRCRGSGPDYCQKEKGKSVFYTHDAIKNYISKSK